VISKRKIFFCKAAKAQRKKRKAWNPISLAFFFAPLRLCGRKPFGQNVTAIVDPARL
jgi:hypothetical protein